MNAPLLMKRIGNIVSWSFLIFSFLLFYSDTHEFIKSLIAAIITFGLVWGTFVVIGWITESIYK